MNFKAAQAPAWILLDAFNWIYIKNWEEESRVERTVLVEKGFLIYNLVLRLALCCCDQNPWQKQLQREGFRRFPSVIAGRQAVIAQHDGRRAWKSKAFGSLCDGSGHRAAYTVQAHHYQPTLSARPCILKHPQFIKEHYQGKKERKEKQRQQPLPARNQVSNHQFVEEKNTTNKSQWGCMSRYG